VRIGTPAVTTRGFGPAEIETLTGWMVDILGHITDEARIARVRAEVLGLCRKFPVYA
jgi:glycine hydroxymethyltransferase